MAPPKRKTGGRVTPKGTRPEANVRTRRSTRIDDDGELINDDDAEELDGDEASSGGSYKKAPVATKRYTPPVGNAYAPSPKWVPILMFTFFILGVLVIVLNYLGVLLPGATNNWYLVVGLGCILAGLMVATQYR
jgi:hypothetical protein